MRSMSPTSHHDGEGVDEILLYIAFIGEAAWCSCELTQYISGRVDAAKGAVVLGVTIVRFLHVFSQTWFILYSSRLRLARNSAKIAMRGRECVTFLLVVNITMFFFGIYESMNDR
ncbi:hypothetical protein PFISCL1PPCAC_28669, partial [Pristionchus fissidentatus]